jgi:large exoprotein involved in heme utilization and adhesion
LSIATGKLIVRDGAQVGTGTFGQGQGGNLSIHASDSVELSGTALLNGQYLSRLSTQSEGAGAAGNLSIATGKLIVRDGAQVGTGTFGQGQGGNLSIHASDSVELFGTTPNGWYRSGLLTQTQGAGVAGNLSIATGKLIVRDGAVVSAATFGQGRGGNLSIHASDSVELFGTAPNGQPVSGLFAQTQGAGAAGNLSIATGKLIVRDGAVVSAATFASGEGGSIQVQSNSLYLANHGHITSRSKETGNAGKIWLQANSLTLEGGAFITSESVSGKGGDIRLDAGKLLLLRHNSLISTTAGNNQNGSDGGNITIHTPFIVAVPKENSDITANAFKGRGGNINITTFGIYGLKYGPRLTPKSDITASSDFGVQGVVEINSLGIDPTRGLGFLPVQSASPDIPQVCKPGAGQADSEFINTGRGGKPPSPGDTLSSNPGWVDLGTSTPRVENSSELARVMQPKSPTAVPIIEAQGWVIGSNGEVILTASAPAVTPYSSWSTPAACSDEVTR